MADPYFKFYIRDWRDDKELKRCRAASRTVWLEMCFRMREAEPFGFFVGRRGEAIDLADFARDLNMTLREVRSAIADLEENGVFSRDKDGRIYSRRYIREAHKSAIRSDAGSNGAVARWGSDVTLFGEERVGAKERRSIRLSAARALGYHTKEQWEQLKHLCHNRCVFCDTSESELYGATLCKDHIVPIFMGGSDGIDNLQPCCRTCNTKKGRDTTDRRPPEAQEWSKVESSKTPGKKSSKTPGKKSSKTPGKKSSKTPGTIGNNHSQYNPDSLRSSALGFGDWPTANDLLRELALLFLAAFGNCFDPVRAEKHLPHYIAVLAQMRSRGVSIAEGWQAFVDARTANGEKPLFMAAAKLAVSFLPARRTNGKTAVFVDVEGL